MYTNVRAYMYTMFLQTCTRTHTCITQLLHNSWVPARERFGAYECGVCGSFSVISLACVGRCFFVILLLMYVCIYECGMCGSSSVISLACVRRRFFAIFLFMYVCMYSCMRVEYVATLLWHVRRDIYIYIYIYIYIMYIIHTHTQMYIHDTYTHIHSCILRV